MRRFAEVMRVYSKRAAILIAVGALLPMAACSVAQNTPTQAEPKRPRITGIDHVRVYVSDVKKSCSFYMHNFGLAATGNGCTEARRVIFPVNWRQRIELDPAPGAGAPSDWLAEIAFATDDLDHMRLYLQTHGVVTGPISTSPEVPRHFEVRDPEGNPIAFVQPWEHLPDGIVSTSQVGQKLLHAGFVVKDKAAENRFYADLLGFRLYWRGGFKDDGLDWYEIQVPDGDNWIEYMLNIPANADHKELGVQNHFSIGVKDIHAAAEQLRKNGLTKFDGPEIGRDGKWALDAYDPDGTRIEFMEYTPAKDPCCHPYTAPHPKP
jgi:catechol 2,3-dioxygenase-like lactoylglutathione lyase family enzyme